MADPVLIVPTEAPGSYAADIQTVTMTAAQVAADYNRFTMSGNDLLIILETAGAPATITINSEDDPMGRTGDLTTVALAANELAVFGPMKALGWRGATGYVTVRASTADVEFGVVQL